MPQVNIDYDELYPFFFIRTHRLTPLSGKEVLVDDTTLEHWNTICEDFHEMQRAMRVLTGWTHD